MKVMKFSVLSTLVAAGLMLGACGGTGSNGELEKLKAENAKLQDDLKNRDSQVDEMMADFNSIEDNLLQVQQKEKAIAAGDVQNSAETGGDAKARIEAEIQSINELMTKNKEQIASLQKKIKNSNMKIGQFEKTIERLNLLIQEKDAEISALNEKLVALNYQVEGLNRSVDSLRTDGDAKSATIVSKDDELNKVYYAMGTKKELIANGVLSKDGVFSGGKGKTLNFSSNYFTQGDARTLSSINIGGKKVKLLSSHPTSSYNLTGEKLEIKDAAAFWRASKYCVIEVK